MLQTLLSAFHGCYADNYCKDIHPELLRDTNRSETVIVQFPVGTNQYLLAGFQRTISKVLFFLCGISAQKILSLI